jgi:hypothetical protein
MTDLFETPVLVTGFNRPDLLEVILKRLSIAKAANVYISIVGPNEVNHDDTKKVFDCQKLAKEFNRLTPDRNRFSDSNLGCGKGMVKAIDWFFSNVPEGIILEDDIEFDSNFLTCMQYLLNAHRSDKYIGSVTGFNPLGFDELIRCMGSQVDYYLHPFFSSWGWPLGVTAGKISNTILLIGEKYIPHQSYSDLAELQEYVIGRKDLTASRLVKETLGIFNIYLCNSR